MNKDPDLRDAYIRIHELQEENMHLRAILQTVHETINELRDNVSPVLQAELKALAAMAKGN